MLALYEYQQITCGDDLNMLEWAYRNIGEGNYNENILFNRVDESCIIAGVEMGHMGTMARMVQKVLRNNLEN